MREQRRDSELIEQFEVKVGKHQGSVLSHLSFCIGGRCCN